MYLYIIIGATLVLYKQVFELLSHLIPLICKGITNVLGAIFTHSAKGVWYVVKKSHNKTYQKIHTIDNYMMNRRWQNK